MGRKRKPGTGQRRQGPAETAASHSRMRQLNWYVLVPCLLAFVVFIPTLHSGFIRDDHYQIERNPQVHSWSYLPRLLTTDVWSQRGEEHEGSFYRPLFSVWLLLIYTIAGSTTWIWHLASILLHVFASFLVFKLILSRIRNEFAAAVGATFFAVHPTHVEAVSWVSAANELQYTICLFVALLFLFESEKGVWDGKTLTALSFGFAALLFKETAIALLLVFAFLLWMKARDSVESMQAPRLALKWCVPWLATGILYLGLRAIVLNRSGLESGKHSWREVFFSGPQLLLFYVKKLLVPLRLSSFYYESIPTEPAREFWIASFVIVGLVFLIAFAAYKRLNMVALGGALMIAPLLPLMAGIRVYEHGDIAHDRYLYLPTVGVCLLVAILAAKFSAILSTWKPLAIGLGALSVCSGAYLTVTQQEWYRNDDAFYARAVELFPENYRAWDLWAQFGFEHNNRMNGLERAAMAYRLQPEDQNAEYFYAKGLFESTQYPQAEPLLEQLSRRTDLAKSRRLIVLLALAQAKMRLGKFAEAEQNLDLLSQTDNFYPGLHNALGNLYQLEGKSENASEEFFKESKVTRSLDPK